MRLGRQFSLRTFLVACFVSALMLAYWASRSRTQQSAVLAIIKLGGNVFYNKPPFPIPSFVVKSIGIDYFCTIWLVQLYPTADQVADDQVMVLKDLSNLTNLSIWPGTKGLTTAPDDLSGGLTDKGIHFLLSNLPKLQHVSLLSAKITKLGEEELCAKSTITSIQYVTHTAYGGHSGGRRP